MTFGVCSSPEEPVPVGVSWRARAACDGMDVDLWFPEKTGESKESKEALRVCGGCEVQTECLQAALDHDEKGIWGGMTEPQRRRLRRRRPPGECDEGSHRGYGLHLLRGEEACGPCKRAHAEYTRVVRNQPKRRVAV